MREGLVSVIIVNFNHKDYLSRCLDSIKSQTYPSLEIIVIDNHSKDGSVQMLRESYPDVKTVVNNKNEFYCFPQNKGIGLAQGEFILSLNNDAFMDIRFVEEMVKVLQDDRRIGMVTGKILCMDGKTIDACGQLLGKSRKPIDRGHGEKDKGQYDYKCYVFSPGGIAPMFRREALEEACVEGEYFDESFKIFYEDLDIAWRLNLQHWQTFYTPDAVAYHIRGGTARREQPSFPILEKYNLTYLSSQMTVFLIRNRYLTMIKNDTLRGILFNLPYILFYEIKLWIYVVFFKPHIIFPLLRTPKFMRRAFRRRKTIKKETMCGRAC